MQGWPSYSAVRDRLYAELAQRLDLENTETAELVDTAVRLREQFWRLGGNLSNDSYQDGYSARILLELAHAREPQNMTIADELVETMQTVEMAKEAGYGVSLLQNGIAGVEYEEAKRMQLIRPVISLEALEYFLK